MWTNLCLYGEFNKSECQFWSYDQQIRPGLVAVGTTDGRSGHTRTLIDKVLVIALSESYLHMTGRTSDS